MPNFGAQYHLIKIRQQHDAKISDECLQSKPADEIESTTTTSNYKPKLSLYVCGLEPSLGISI